MAFSRVKRQAADVKPLTLSDGTEVYEVTQSFSVNTLIDISFNRTRPIRNRQRELYQRLDSLINEEPINTELAKLNFVGCSMVPPDNAINKSIDEALNSEHGKLYSERSRWHQLEEEIPAETFGKLSADLEKFATDLQQYETSDLSADGANIKLLTQGIQGLNATMKELGASKEYKAFLSKHYRPHDRVDMALTGKIWDIKNPETEEEDDHGDYISRLYGDEKGAWILYGQKKSVQTLGTADAQFLDLESRVSSLEQTVGYVTDMKNPYPDTLNAVDLLESRFEYVFGAQWGQIKKHATKMMSDLKNIKYHLDLMQARYKPAEKQTRIEWERLEDIYIMMRQWDHVVFELINIVKRLKSLQNYHYRSCLFINRVNTIYGQQEMIYRSLKQDERTLRNCLKSMDQNNKLMENNAALLDQRLRVLQEKLRPVAMQASGFEQGR